MIRRIVLGVSAVLLVVGLPVAALAVSDVDRPFTPSLSPERLEMNQRVRPAVSPENAPANAAQQQAQTRQRLQVHIETGPPEGFEPVQKQQRLHEQAQAGALTQTAARNEVRQRSGDYRAQGDPIDNGERDRRRQTEDAPRGNQEAGPRTDCPNDGECAHEGGAAGNGPHGKNG